jgi:hypothetical protein
MNGDRRSRRWLNEKLREGEKEIFGENIFAYQKKKKKKNA